MTFGLTQHTIDIFISVFEQNSKVDKAIMFGSRAKGNYRPDSDIDISLRGQSITTDDIIKLSVALEEKGIKHKFDLINYSAIKEPALTEHIDRVGIEFYRRWKKVPLGELCTVQNGYSFKSNEFTSDAKDAYEVLKMGHIERGGGLRKNPKKDFIPREEKFSKWILNKDDIVMAMTDMKDNVVILGVPAMIDKDNHYVLNQRVARIKVNDKKKLDPFFLYYYLIWDEHLHTLQSKANSGVQVNLTTDAIKSSEIEAPPLSEQLAIADTLTSLDSKIHLLHNENKTIEQLARALFRKWFVEEEEDTWKTTKLSDHTEVFRGLSYKGNGLTDEQNGVPMHNLNSVYEFGGYKNEGIKYYKGEYRERHLLNVGDIIVTNTEQGHEHRLIGFPAIVPKVFGEIGLFSQHIYRLVVLKNSYLTNQFIYYLLMTPAMREQIVGATNGSTVNMLAIDGLQISEFKLPPKDKVEKFSLVVKDYWLKNEKNQNQIDNLTQLRDTLLSKLMNGEARVN